MSLFSKFHIDFEIVQYRLSIARNNLCQVGNIFSHVDRFHGACRFYETALSNLSVKGPMRAGMEVGGGGNPGV